VIETADGFVVFLKSRDPREVSLSPTYRGIDRTPPYSQEAAESGFEDPVIFGSLVNEAGLCPTEEAALEVMHRFASVYPPDTLELGFVSTIHPRGASSSLPPVGYSFLGFDVAGTESPFWSILNDRPSEAEIQHLLKDLNEHGLFRSDEEARSYLAAYRELRLADWDLPLTVWAVYIAERELFAEDTPRK
jgi:hypothetical protein